MLYYYCPCRWRKFNVVGGFGLTSIGGTQYLNLGEITDQFNTSESTTTSPFVGFAVGYQWNHLNRKIPVALNLSIAGYYTHNVISGIETPAINQFDNEDTLNYSANQNGMAWMLEPKFIFTTYAWQPYFIAGIGIATNWVNNYNETPTDPSGQAVTNNFFAAKNTTNFAYDVGVGVQHSIHTFASGKHLMLAAEYRYMNWGEMNLGTTPAQTTLKGPTFNNLQTNIIDASLGWQF